MAKTYTLRNIPPDVFEIVQKEQSQIKLKRKTNSFSFECTIYKMIRDLNKCKNENPEFKPEPV